MLHIQIILLFMTVVLHDAWWSTEHPRAAETGGSIGPGDAPVAASVMLTAALAAGTGLIIASFAREVERRGSFRAAAMAERMLVLSRWLAVLLHATNVLALGLLESLRARLGDGIAVDELLVISLPLVVFAAGWWAYYPVERAFRDATTLRLLDQGRPVFPAPSRGQFVAMNLRHQVLLSLVPIALMLVWSETVERVLRRLATSPNGSDRVARWLADPEILGLVSSALQLVGVAVVFAFSPLLLRRIWDTVRLGPGPLRSRLSAICARAGVRIRDLLVWRTHGSMINGAVIGLIGPLRYILLTDALLDHLTTRQIEAVMAHEVGHARHRHLPWLAVAMLMGMVGGAVLLSLGVGAVAESARILGWPLPSAMLASGLVDGTVALGTMVIGLAWFGFVSRRFEWQADAFAVQQLSLTPPPDTAEGPTLWHQYPEEATGDPPRITPEAVRSMTGALDAVAELNHLSRHAPSWRHGSIASRQRRLREIIGQPVDGLRIDRRVRWLKRGLGAMLVGFLALLAWSSLS